MREVTLLHHDLGPNRIHQLFLLQDVAAALDQRQQKVKGFRRERKWVTVAEQDALRRVNVEGSKCVEVIGYAAHDRVRE